jgi:hypothetical protein
MNVVKQEEENVRYTESKFQQLLKKLCEKGISKGKEIGIYIFGTGLGGQVTLQHLQSYKCDGSKFTIKGFIDNNTSKHGSKIEDIMIFPPNILFLDELDFILISSYSYSQEIELQLLELGVDEDNIIFPESWLFELLPDSATQETKYTYAKEAHSKLYKQYVEELFRNATTKSEEFVEYDEKIQIKLREEDIKLIAFYLPQFHPIPENDEWWGRGFTEWNNVTKAIPQYLGQHQPQLPIDVGFYDLRNIDVMKRQIQLAKQYGIYGFCFHHYWFAGKRLLETPVDNFLKHPELDIPFCLCWANENWTRRWDAKEHEILIAQNHSPEDDVAFIKDMARYFVDSRYIRIMGKPVLIVYRSLRVPNIAETVERWREYCIREGIGEIFIVGVKNYGFDNPRKYGLDALIEFPPHEFQHHNITSDVLLINEKFKGQIYDYAKDIERSLYYLNKNLQVKRKKDHSIIFRTVMPGWDNTARRPNNPTILHGSNPKKYQEWLESIIAVSKQQLQSEMQMVFINAWNEWAEGAHLEPDRKYGYGNLQATANALIHSRK